MFFAPTGPFVFRSALALVSTVCFCCNQAPLRSRQQFRWERLSTMQTPGGANKPALLIGLFLFSTGAFGQVAGRLVGAVADVSGSPVPGAKVGVMLQGGKIAVLTSATNEDGLFAIPGVRPEFYDLTIEAAGFTPVTLRAVKVDPARETNLNTINLEVAAVAQTVEVSAQIQGVQTGSAEISTTVTNQQIRDLPVLDRQVISLLTTQAGVSDGRGATVINGMRTSFATVTMDGINIQDNFIRSNALSFIPNRITVDQVSEVTISTSNSNSTLGGGAAQVSFVSPSGTNSYHGNAYWYNRNSVFAANDWYNNKDGIEKPFLNQNQFGGSLGGPIVKDKLLFYGNYEVLRLRQQELANRTILTADARRGFYTYRDSAGQVRSVNILQTKGVQIDPHIADLLTKVPGPESGNNFRRGDSREDLLRNSIGYSYNIRNNLERDNLTGKVDYLLSTKHTFSGTYSMNRELVDRPDLENSFATIPRVSNDGRRHLLSVGWRWNPTPALTNELRGGFNLSPSLFNNSEEFPAFLLDRTTTYFDYPINTNTLPQGRDTNTYAFMDNASWMHGRHNIQFGFQNQRIRTSPFNDAGIYPVYALGISANNTNGLTQTDLPGISGNDLTQANLLLATLAGYVTSATQSFNVTSRDSGYVPGATELRNFRYDNYAWYVQDTWKMSPKLTVTFGLRYEYFTPLDERDSLTILPRIEGGNFINTLLSNATLDFAGNAVGRPYYKKDWNNFAPNVGVAYDLFGNGKSAIRAGYGVSYVNDDTIVAIRNTLQTNSGLNTTASIVGQTGRVSTNRPIIATPTFTMPRTFMDNNLLDPAAAFGLPDPNLVTPYVQQWNFGLQQEISGFVFEGRYVGNKLTKGLRSFDYNQVNINAGGFLDDFRRAQQNGFLARNAGRGFDPAYNPAVAGSQPLTVFPLLGSQGLLTNATIRGQIERGEVGTLAQTYVTNRLNGPINFFANPLALGANTMTNYSNSTYNSLQVEVRRRTNFGAQFQANYTWSKVLSDALGDQQTRFEAFLDMNNAALEHARAPFDITHAIKSNFVYELPFGAGRRLNYSPLSRVLSGWIVGGNMIWQSGSPFSVLSTRGTFNRGARSATNTAGSTLGGDQLDEKVGFFMTGNGPMFIHPSAIGSDGRGVGADGAAPFNGQIFVNPSAGEIGALQRRSFNGPWTFNLDFSIVKRTQITERQSLELRMDAFNSLNHATFYVGDEAATNTRFNINQPTFGTIISNAFDSRKIQFGLYYRF